MTDDLTAASGNSGAAGLSLEPPPPLRCALHRLALFLDVDGTLAPIAPRPQLSRVPVATRRTLRALQQSGVALAALSGRPLNQVRRLLHPVDIPVGGSHGAQILLAKGRSIRAMGRMPDGLIDFLQQQVDSLPGVWLERKPAALAVHWRQAPEYCHEVACIVGRAVQELPGWQVVPGHCVHEIRPRGRNKGTALIRLMRRPGFSGRWPLAIGDDRTDEDAFAAALALGGGAIRIGPAAETLAPWTLPDVAALADWLRAQLHKVR